MICAACGLADDDPRLFQADHIRPRWAHRPEDPRRDDPQANGQVLCLDCHAAKTGAEMWVWRLRARTRALFVLRPLTVNHRPAIVGAAVLWTLLLGGLFLAGLVDGRWWAWAAGIVVFNTYVCAKIAQSYRRHFGHSRGPGLNALSDWDMRLEQAAPGSDGWLARQVYGWVRPFGRRLRYWPVFCAVAYIAGTLALHAATRALGAL